MKLHTKVRTIATLIATLAWHPLLHPAANAPDKAPVSTVTILYHTVHATLRSYELRWSGNSPLCSELAHITATQAPSACVTPDQAALFCITPKGVPFALPETNCLSGVQQGARPVLLLYNRELIPPVEMVQACRRFTEFLRSPSNACSAPPREET